MFKIWILKLLLSAVKSKHVYHLKLLLLFDKSSLEFYALRLITVCLVTKT